MVAYKVANKVTNDEAEAWYEKLGDYALYSIPNTIVSAGASFANTGIAVANMFREDDEKFGQVDGADWVDALGDGGYFDNAAQYYRDNRGVVDLGGLIVGSLVPGTLAVRGLRALQVGKAVKAGNMGPEALAQNWFRQRGVDSPKLQKLIQGIRDGDKTFNTLGNAKTEALVRGVGQQFAEAAVYEAATILTMNQNSVMNQEEVGYMESIWNSRKDLMFGAVLGGGFGSVFQVAGDLGKLKRAANLRETTVSNIATLVKTSALRDETGKLSKWVVPGDAIAQTTESQKSMLKALALEDAQRFEETGGYLHLPQGKVKVANKDSAGNWQLAADVRERLDAGIRQADMLNYQDNLAAANGDQILASQMLDLIAPTTKEGFGDVTHTRQPITSFSQLDFSTVNMPSHFAVSGLESINYVGTSFKAPKVSAYEIDLKDYSSFAPLMPSELKKKFKFAGNRKDLTVEMVDEQLRSQITKNGIGSLDKAIARKAAGKVKTDAPQLRAEQAILSFGNDTNIFELFTKYDKLTPTTQKMLDEWMDITEKYNPLFKSRMQKARELGGNPLDKNFPKNMSVDDYMKAFDTIVEEGAQALKSADIKSNMMGAIMAAERDGHKFSGVFKNLVNKPVFRNQWLEMDNYVNARTGAQQKEFIPTIMDMAHGKRVRGRGVGKNYQISEAYYFAVDDAMTLAKQHKMFSKDNQSHVIMREFTEKQSVAFDGLLMKMFDKTRKGDSTPTKNLFNRVEVKVGDTEFKFGESDVATFERAMNTRSKIKRAQIDQIIADAGVKNPNDLLADTVGQHISLEEIAIRANVHQDELVKYISGDDKVLFSFRSDPLNKKVTHIKVRNTREGQLEAGSELAAAQKTRSEQMARDMTNAAIEPIFGRVFGTHWDEVLRSSYADELAAGNTRAENIGQKATSFQGGPGFITNPNTEYGTLSEFASNTGKVVERGQTKLRAIIDENLQVPAQKVVQDPAALAEHAVLEQKFRSNRYQSVVDDPSIPFDYVPVDQLAAYNKALADAATAAKNDFGHLEGLELQDAIAEVVGSVSAKMIDSMTGITVKNQATKDFFEAYRKMNDELLVENMSRMNFAQGNGIKLQKGVMYMGKFDTATMNHHYLVKMPQQMLGEDIPQMGFITAPTKELLEEKRAKIMAAYKGDSAPPTFISRGDTKEYNELLDQYDAKLDLTDIQVDSTLGSKNKLFDYMPEPDARNVAGMINSMKAQSAGMLRKAVAMKYEDELFALRQLDRYGRDSTFGRTGKPTAYAEQINQMLNLSSKNKFENWIQGQNAIVRAVDNGIAKLSGLVAMFDSRKATDQKWVELGEYVKKSGFPQVANPEEIAALSKAPRNIVEPAIAKINGAVATFMLRLDGAQAIVNTMSTPIMLMPELQSLRKFLTAEQVAKLDGKLGGSNMKLMQQAVKDFFNDKALVAKYKEMGIVTSVLDDVHAAMDEIGGQLQEAAKTKFQKGLREAGNTAAKVGGVLAKPVDKSEEFVKFVAARSAELMIDDVVKISGGTIPMSAGQKSSLIRSVVTKTHGNYTASQRPALFQGGIGQAIGLFQTYQFNLLQRFLTHIQNGQPATARTMMKAQAGIFGVQSVPGFQHMNSYIAERTESGEDFYTETTDTLGEVGNVLLYGLGSHLTAPVAAGMNATFGTEMALGIDFFNRGDLTPRTPILLPTSVDEIPAYSVISKTAKGMGTLLDNISGGAPIGGSLLNMLSTNGFNRPLAGIAQLWQGQKTTSQGSAMYFYDDPLQMTNWTATAAKLLGTKSVDEAIAFNSFYRASEMRTARYEKLDKIGQAVKQKIRSGEEIGGVYQSTLDEYVASGGDARNFNTWMGNNYVNATESQIKKLATATTPEAKYMWDILDGDLSNLY